MKKLTQVTLMLTCAVGFSSCFEHSDTEKKQDSISVNKSIDKTAASDWVKQFEDTFESDASLSKWTKVQRTDYNSKYCDYKSAVPTIQVRDGKGCLEIKTSKLGENKYQSGLIKSIYQYTPENNSEYRIAATIKLLAMDGANYKSFKETYGAWPAFWTVQEDGWPTSCEIDIVEGYSFAPGASRFTSNLFYGTVSGTNQLGNLAERQYPSSFNVDGNNGWHLYECFIRMKDNAVTVTVKIDNTIVSTYTNSSVPKLNLNNFKKHNIILNLNVGSNDSSFIDPNKINLFTAAMMWVDEVSVYKRTI
ncbi:MAG: family 16 glycosylhydrolase [Flavobacterium sp.]|uniref:glycoside hydrolase family 16 protein n=1 Tax=Flavobacterium sp. TaxID=239 RepID=UPI001B1B107C|nr:family 16 glycosylhydrolase [Flavobacterium sp.]MBO9584507.1 family 16 glycosylhydrolase [Flavobacterium sp.]